MATRFGAAVAFLLMALCASAGSYWDGGAALQRGDSSFEGGFFAASNSFPADTEIVVESLETGKTTNAVVSQRIDGQSDLLVLLSPKAAAALGITQGHIAPVRVTVKSGPTLEARSLPGDQPLSRDPDVNPAVGVPEEILAAAEAAGPQGTVESLQLSEEARTERLAELPTSVGEPAVNEPAEQQGPTAAPDERLLRELASRTPQKQLFQPPREDEKFVYHAPATPSIEIATLNGLEAHAPPAQPGPQTELAEASLPPEMNPEVEERMASSAIPAPAETPPLETHPEPQPTLGEQGKTELSGVVPASPPPAGTETVVTLEPTAPKPPPEPAKEAPAAALAARPAGRGADYFLQLGAFSNEKQARDLASSLPSAYPISILSPEAPNRQVYRILLGPLNKAESGTLLYRFRSLGFTDAFLKQGE